MQPGDEVVTPTDRLGEIIKVYTDYRGRGACAVVHLYPLDAYTDLKAVYVQEDLTVVEEAK